MIAHTGAWLACVVACLVACAAAQRGYEAEERAPRYIADAGDAKPTPVPILKQINRHHEDGSYTYGYEAADGSFKIETKLANGEVKGKYGYKDDTGKLRVIEYGANKYGFQPSGEGITVAPPTLVDESAQQQQPRPKQQQFQAQPSRAQYRPAPQSQLTQDYDYEEPVAPQPTYRAPAPAPASYRAPPPAPTSAPYRAPAAAPRPPKPAFFAGAAPAPAERPQTFFRPEPKPSVQYAAPVPTSAPASARYTQAFDFAPSQNQFRAPSQNHFQEPEQNQYRAPAQNQFRAPEQTPFQPAQPQRAPYSKLDELIKEFGLPAGGAAPLHDITFGSY